MADNAARRIVITGATRGLGRALAEGFAARGHQVLGCGRSPDAAADLGRRLGDPHDVQAVDVSDEPSVQAWAQRLLARYGPPDLLLNNAGVMNRPATLWEVGREEFDQIIDINIKGVAHVIRHLVPAMIERGSGVIVNLSSGWGRATSPEVGPYCASKWAIEGLTRALAQELPRGLAAIPLNPGIIDTEMLRTCWGDSAAHYSTPEVWAESAVPFLLSLGPKDSGKPLTVPGH